MAHCRPLQGASSFSSSDDSDLLSLFEYLINWEKSSLSPSQILTFLGAVLDILISWLTQRTTAFFLFGIWFFVWFPSRRLRLYLATVSGSLGQFQGSGLRLPLYYVSPSAPFAPTLLASSGPSGPYYPPDSADQVSLPEVVLPRLPLKGRPFGLPPPRLGISTDAPHRDANPPDFIGRLPKIHPNSRPYDHPPNPPEITIFFFFFFFFFFFTLQISCSNFSK